jgi:hypothetical protein
MTGRVWTKLRMNSASTSNYFTKVKSAIAGQGPSRSAKTLATRGAWHRTAAA